MNVNAIAHGVGVTVFQGAQPLYLLTDSGNASLNNEWYYGFELAAEKERGLNDIDDHLHPATFEATLEPGSSFTFVASREQNPNLNGAVAFLRPNQIFAVSLPESPLTLEQQRQVVEACERSLLTSHGLRSLATDDPQYIVHYGGDQFHRDGAYHQGTVWEWLIGPFVLAHLRVFNNPSVARQYLEPMQHHLYTAGVGTISEISNGDPPMEPKGCIAQAWSVGEVLRAWLATE